VYGLLPEHYRFSRALILIGSLMALCFYLLSRWVYGLMNIQKFKHGTHKSNTRIAIIGSEAEFIRVMDLLEKTKIRTGFVGFISNESNGIKNNHYIGNFEQLDETIQIHHITEIIFCARDVSSSDIIGKMIKLVTRGVEFKIAPPESLSIIGSNSIDTAGDLYVIDINNLGRPENRRKKRLLDILISTFIIGLSPLLVWFQKNKLRFLGNTLKVLFGFYSWVGYGKCERFDLPEIRPSVFTPADGLAQTMSEEQTKRVFLNYSKDYQSENDFKILFRNWRRLDQ
jgi:hypothetical protein